MPFVGLKNGAGPISHGSYTAVTADDTAGSVAIDTSLSAIECAVVQVVRSGKVVTSDAGVSWSAGALTVTDGTSVYAITAGDLINWIAIGV